jgi:hypothetical protein
MFDAHQQSHSPLIYPSDQFDSLKSPVDILGDMAHSSKLRVLPDGRVLLTGSGMEMKDILSTVAEFYLSRNSNIWRKQSLLVPHLSRYGYLDLVLFTQKHMAAFFLVMLLKNSPSST